MAAPENLARATLTLLEPRKGGDILDTIELPFNPKEWSITHTADWKVDTTKKSVPPPQFRGPLPASASVELFLDESDKPGGDISRVVAKLKALVVPDPASITRNAPCPPHVRFAWGTAVMFKGYVESVAVRYTLFRANGSPVRGTCTVNMKEFPAPAAGQNPTSGGEGGHRTHCLRAGDSLASVAYAEYGDPAAWRHLAEANGIDDPMRLRPGIVLSIPPRPRQPTTATVSRS
jgi:hypothetical protein